MAADLTLTPVHPVDLGGGTTIITEGGGGSRVVKDSVLCATTTADQTAMGATAQTGTELRKSSNGAFPATIDGIDVTIGDRILVKNSPSTFRKGIFVLTDLGSGSTPWRMVLAEDVDEDSDWQGGVVVYVIYGITQGNTAWWCAAQPTFVIGDDQNWLKVGGDLSAYLTKSTDASSAALTLRALGTSGGQAALRLYGDDYVGGETAGLELYDSASVKTLWGDLGYARVRTPPPGDNSTRIASTAFVASAVGGGGGGAPIADPDFTGTLQVFNGDGIPYVDFGTDEQFPPTFRSTSQMVSSNRDPINYNAGDVGLRQDEYGNVLIGPNYSITDAIRSGGSMTGWAQFYYRLKSNFLYLGAGLVIGDVSDATEQRGRRYASPHTNVLVGSPVVIGNTPVTLYTETMGTDPESETLATTTTTGTNALNSTTINVTSTAAFKSTSTATPQRIVKINGEWITYTSKTGTSFTGCSAHSAISAGASVVQSQWEAVGANARFTAWPDVDHGGRANFANDYPYTIAAGGPEDYAGIVVAINQSGSEDDPDPEGEDSAAAQNLRLGSVLYKRVGFGATPGMLQAVGAWHYAKGNYTITTTPQTITLKGAMPRANEKGGYVLVEGSSTLIHYTGVSGAVSGTDTTLQQGFGTTKLLNCTVASGSLSITDGQRIFQRMILDTGDKLSLVAKPEPRPGSGLTTYKTEAEPQGLFRISAGQYYIDDDAIPGSDRPSGYSDMGSVSWHAVEPHTATKQGGEIGISTVPKGHKGTQHRVIIDTYGLVNCLNGIGIGQSRVLGPQNDAIQSVLNDGQYSQTDVNPLVVDNSNMLGGATAAVAVVTAGDATHNEVQTITISGNPGIGSTYLISWTDPDGRTATIVADPTWNAGQLLSKLQAMYPVGDATPLFTSGDLQVAFDRHPPLGVYAKYTITYGGAPVGTSGFWRVNNTVATTITNITDALDGQIALFRFSNGNTSIRNSVSGGSGAIRLAPDMADGAVVTFAQNDMLLLQYQADGAVWNTLSTPRPMSTLALDKLDWKNSVRVATTAALSTNTQGGTGNNVLTATSNGAFPAVDGVTLALNDRILVKNEATAKKNGIYYLSQVGDGSNPWKLTRTTDADSSAKVTSGLRVATTEGSTNGLQTWTLTTADPIVLNTTSLTFTNIGSGSYQPLDTDLTQIAALSPANDDIVQRKGGVWTNRTMAQLSSDLALTGFQPLDSDLTTIAGLTPGALDVMQYSGGWRARTPSNLLSDMVLARTPETFGAIGDGVANDTTAVSNWLGATGPKAGKPGSTYLIRADMTIADLTGSTSGQTIDFRGAKIKVEASQSAGIIVTGSNVTLMNLVFDGNRANSATGKGIEWRGTGGRMFNVESSNHVNCEGGIALITGTPDLTCTDCQAHNNGDRAVANAGSKLRTPAESGTSLGVDGFNCIAGTLRTYNCRANYNSRCGLYIGPSAAEQCVVDLVQADGNFSALIRTSGNSANRDDRTYAGTNASVHVRSNVGTIIRCIMDGRDAAAADASRYGLIIGSPGGPTATEGERWKVGYVSAKNFRWQNVPTGEAADGMHLRGGHYTHVASAYLENIAGYGLDISGGANNVGSGDNAIAADHRVDSIYARYVSNPPVVWGACRRTSIGHLDMVGCGPVSIGEGLATTQEHNSIDKITAFSCSAGVVIAEGTSTFEDFYIGEIEMHDCDVSLTTIPDQVGLIAMSAPLVIGKVVARTKSGGTPPPYILSSYVGLYWGTTHHKVGIVDAPASSFGTAIEFQEATTNIDWVSATELEYLSGATSNIQAQINAITGGVGTSDPELLAIAGLTSAADKVPYFTGSGTAALADLSSAMRTFMSTPSSANLRSLITDETGTGAAVFATSPALVTPDIGTPSAGTLTNATGLPLAGLTGGSNDDIVQRKAGAWTNRTIAQLLTDLNLGATYQPLDSDLTTIAGLTATTDNFIQSKSSAWASRTPAQVATDLSSQSMLKPGFQIDVEGGGFLGMNYDSRNITGGTVLTSQRVYWESAGLKAGTVISNIYVPVTTNGSGETSAYVGIATQSGTTMTVVAVSSDIKAGLETGSVPRWQACACSYTVPTTGRYFFFFHAIGGTITSLGRINAGSAFTEPNGVGFYGVTSSVAAGMAVNDTKTFAAGGFPIPIAWA